MFVEIQALQSLCYMFIYIRQKIKLLVSCILYLVPLTGHDNWKHSASAREHWCDVSCYIPYCILILICFIFIDHFNCFPYNLSLLYLSQILQMYMFFTFSCTFHFIRIYFVWFLFAAINVLLLLCLQFHIPFIFSFLCFKLGTADIFHNRHVFLTLLHANLYTGLLRTLQSFLFLCSILVFNFLYTRTFL